MQNTKIEMISISKDEYWMINFKQNKLRMRLKSGGEMINLELNCEEEVWHSVVIVNIMTTRLNASWRVKRLGPGLSPVQWLPDVSIQHCDFLLSIQVQAETLYPISRGSSFQLKVDRDSLPFRRIPVI